MNFDNMTILAKEKLIKDIQTSINHQVTSRAARSKVVSQAITVDRQLDKISSLRKVVSNQTDKIAKLEEINEELVDAIKNRDELLALHRKLTEKYQTKILDYESIYIIA